MQHLVSRFVAHRCRSCLAPSTNYSNSGELLQEGDVQIAFIVLLAFAWIVNALTESEVWVRLNLN